ncbi:condensation domain-containing protein [Actinosynnema mirum]|uniref:Condensation domain protein n=1 Tax=Actinosynnema mirum (strain ATCC 29888 / DSM 43827 / JCM 3225 / NBRC 14064 / NCIMB 13271 / NRRL B-12336 / IMRU 3971 / 101) TaxID=446462 RepID=C6WBZ6_ACTMD|nr:condensation domain-containing protein [Actinosynnema mirum]ACU37563.1 condensation domain protein [Actinosynnema mirum DSM 43827]
MTEPDPRVARLSDTKQELLNLWLADGPAARSAPRTGAERIVTGIWGEVLDLDEVGLDDDYFALGGDSVHAIVIVAKLEAAGLRISAQELFSLGTARAVAERAGAEQAGVGWQGAERAVAGPVVTDHPLSPMQEGMLYHSVGGSSPGAYVVQACCSLTGDLDLDAFRAAWTAVVEATPALRASFDWADGARPHQVVAEAAVPDVQVLDWRDRDDRDTALADHLEQDRDRGFDLGRAPLFRLTLVRESDRTHRCVWTHHHLVLDGWSQQLVLADVLATYGALVAGVELHLPRRPGTAEYLAWLNRQDRAAADEFWNRQFTGLTGATRIARPGCVRGQVVARRGGEVVVSLPEERTAELSGLCRGNGLTTSTALYGAWALLLSELCGGDDVVFGVTVSGRPPTLPGATELIGVLINTLPLRVRCATSGPALPWLRELQDRLAAMREHGHVPLSGITRSVGLHHRDTLFDTIVVVENFPVTATGNGAGPLVIGDVRTVVDEGYPLVLEVVPGGQLLLRARHDPTRLDAEEVAALLDALLACLGALIADPEQSPSRLRTLLAGHLRQHRERTFHARQDTAAKKLATARRQATSTPGRAGVADTEEDA